MNFVIHKIFGEFAFIPTIVWDYECDGLYIKFLFWEFGIEW